MTLSQRDTWQRNLDLIKLFGVRYMLREEEEWHATLIGPTLRITTPRKGLIVDRGQQLEEKFRTTFRMLVGSTSSTFWGFETTVTELPSPMVPKEIRSIHMDILSLPIKNVHHLLDEGEAWVDIITHLEVTPEALLRHLKIPRGRALVIPVGALGDSLWSVRILERDLLTLGGRR